MHPKPFADLPVSPANHFRLYFYAAVSQVLATSAERRLTLVRSIGTAPKARAWNVPLPRRSKK